MASRRPGTLHLLAGTAAAVLLLAGCSGQPTATKSTPGKPGATSSASTSEAPAPSAPAPPPPKPRAGIAKVGQCFQMSARQSRAAISTGRQVRCSAPHTAVVAYVGLVPRALTVQTPLAKRRAVAKRVCTPALARAAGGTPESRATSLLTWTFFTPSAAQLDEGARWVRCDVVARSGSVLVPLTGNPPFLRRSVPEGLRICQTAQGADISCARRHAFRVEAAYREAGAAYPAPRTYTQVARDRCKTLMDGYGGYWQPPSRAGWAAGDRFIRCLRQDSPPSG